MKLLYSTALVFILFVRHSPSISAQDGAVPVYPNVAEPIAVGEVPPALPLVRLFPANVNQFLRAFPSSGLHFSQLVATKIDMNHSPPQIIFLIESYRSEMKQVDVMQPKIKKVTQTYTRPDGTNAEREVSITEFVPVQILQQVSQPAGLKPKSMNLVDFEFYDLDSKPIPPAEAAKALATLRPIFLIDRFNGALPPLGKYEKQVLKPDVLIATTKLEVHETHRMGGPQAPGVAIPFFPAGDFGGRPIPIQVAPGIPLPIAPPADNAPPPKAD